MWTGDAAPSFQHMASAAAASSKSISHNVSDAVNRPQLDAAIVRCLAHGGGPSEWIASYEALNRQLSGFAETPLLLDSHTEPLLRSVINTLRDDVLQARPCSMEAASVLYLFCKVRGVDAVGEKTHETAKHSLCCLRATGNLTR